MRSLQRGEFGDQTPAVVKPNRTTRTQKTAETQGRVFVRNTLGRLVLLTAALTLPTTAAADQLVVQLDRFSIAGRPEGVSDAVSAEQRVALPSGLPSTLRLPLATAADGSLTISLRQENLVGSVTRGEAPPVVRLRVVSPAVGNVTEDARGNVAVGMDTILAFDDLATGKSRTFDVKIRGSGEASAAYGEELPIYIEAWRRGEDGKPLENPTKENRSFWGTLSGHFER